jgi:hypothetical protein
MPTFYAACKKCEKKLERKLKKDKRERTTEEYEELVLFETGYAFSATDQEIAEAMTCPRCNSKECERTFYGYNQTFYVRGNGYLDRDGCKRDMHLHKLVTDDPYKEMRVAGEVDEMKAKFKRAGQHNPNSKHMVMGGGEMEKAVRDAVNTPDPPASLPPASSS